ncbi:hypothetical protein AVEN_140137-1 [Araneus ventricosus]|uniref:Uncharacterized protein n=1 Tax=Araneus ventricosus TaxID=182803 RepID=A0A4Y2FUQ5_ARAVE|nr:hypothetical protein AVEN_140137-1 [Araneus ventricosus]
MAWNTLYKRWLEIGWMEMGLTQTAAARRFNVSRSVVQRHRDEFQSENSVYRRPVSRSATCFNPCRRSLSSTFGLKKEDQYYALARFV